VQKLLKSTSTCYIYLCVADLNTGNLEEKIHQTTGELKGKNGQKKGSVGFLKYGWHWFQQIEESFALLWLSGEYSGRERGGIEKG